MSGQVSISAQGIPSKSPPCLGPNDPETFRPHGVGRVTLDDELKVEGWLAVFRYNTTTGRGRAQS